MKFLAAGLVIVLVLLQYRLWLGDGGMREVHRLRAEIEVQREQNSELKERNRTLAAEVQDLKKGTVAIEERARTDLGMVGRARNVLSGGRAQRRAATLRRALRASPKRTRRPASSRRARPKKD